VRDLLLGREPKDFDVATDAHPEQVRQLFRNCRLVGRRFRLAHVQFGQEIIEVATFRAAASPGREGEWLQEASGRLLRDNVFGTIEEDAFRRDFTANALYYDIADFSVIDYVGGMEDLRRGVLRLIGDPESRYREDPVRMLRAIRFMTKLGFVLDPACEAPIRKLASLLKDISPARLYDEVLKLCLSGVAVQTFELLRHYGLFEWLFPATERALSVEYQGFPSTFLIQALKATDRRLGEGLPVAPYFLYAALLWGPVRLEFERRVAAGEAPAVAMQEAASAILAEQVKRVAIARRVSLPMREVWMLQPRLERCQNSRPLRLLAHPRFKAAYDFLLLRCAAGEVEAEVSSWWTRFLQADEKARLDMLAKQKQRRRRRSKVKQ
jgi:poly(A) polymerase